MSSKLFKQLQLDVKQNIGKGSFSNVKKAWSEKRQQAVALKIITLSPIEKDNNEQEFDILTQTHHPNIISIYQLATTATHMYIVMELAETGDLLRRLKTKGKLEDTEARRMFRQILEAVNYLHKELNVAHRDLKCENILLDRCENAKLGDFSFAKICKEDDLSRTYCGSISYAAPEVLLHKPYDPKLSDIWSLGVLLFSMVSATLPYSGEFVSSVLIQQRAIVHFDKILPPNSTACTLISLLLKRKPKHRITYHKILETEWLRNTDYVYYYGTESPNDNLSAINCATQTSSSIECQKPSPKSVFRRVKIANDSAKIRKEKQVSPSAAGQQIIFNDNKSATIFSSNCAQEETKKQANKKAKDFKKEVNFSHSKGSSGKNSAIFDPSSNLSVTQHAPNELPPKCNIPGTQASSKTELSKSKPQSKSKQYQAIQHEQNGKIDNSDSVKFCSNTDAVDAVTNSFTMLRTILQATKRKLDQKLSHRSAIRKNFLESEMALHSVPEESVVS